MKAATAVGAAAVYTGSAAAAYFFARIHVLAPATPDGADSEGSHTSCAYDRLAGGYDNAIGQEEWAMWYPLMRRTLLREAEGRVLELSAGTGRNFQYYDFNKVSALTVADLSRAMLHEAEDKFYDRLRLGEKHPDTRVDFVVCDAHCMVQHTPAAGFATAPDPKQARKSWWSRAQTIGQADSQGQSSSSASDGQFAFSTSTNSSSSVDDQDTNVSTSSRQALREMPGFGSPLNLFKILLGGRTGSATLEPSKASKASAGGATSSSSVQSSNPDDARMQSHSTSHDGRGTSSLPQPCALPQAAHSTTPGTYHDHSHSSGSSNSSCSSSSSSSSDSHRHRDTIPACACGLPEPSASDRSYATRCSSGRNEAGLALTRFPAGSFDTVVDTFGLCSHEDPVQVLREMARVVRPGGKVLLLQHGRGSGWFERWVNERLDGGAAAHAAKWGCWWNRDILDLVGQAGLQIDKLTRWHFGTSYFIIARPN